MDAEQEIIYFAGDFRKMGIASSAAVSL